MKSLGLKIVDAKNWKFVDADDDTAASAGPATPGAATPAPTPKKRGRPKKDDSSPQAKRKKMATPKKEKLSEEEVKQEEGATDVADASEMANAALEAMAQDGADGKEN